jgi:hypothetical protein
VSTWAHVSSRLGNVKPETKAIAQEIHAAAQKAGHDIWFMWGMGTSVEHRTGLALDLMVRNRTAGDWVRNYIWANRKRLRLRHVIWEQHITSTITRPGVRVKMADRGNPTANHYDHNHVWFFAGLYRAPSSTTTPSDLKRGSSGTSVRKLQNFLRTNFPAYRNSVRVQPRVLLAVDGDFGPQTEAWVKEFQRRVGLSRTGVVDSKTLAKLKQHGYN